MPHFSRFLCSHLLFFHQTAASPLQCRAVLKAHNAAFVLNCAGPVSLKTDAYLLAVTSPLPGESLALCFMLSA